MTKDPVPFPTDMTELRKSHQRRNTGHFSSVYRRRNIAQEHFVSCKVHFGSEDSFRSSSKCPWLDSSAVLVQHFTVDKVR